MSSPYRLLGICGSLRANSFSCAVLTALAKAVAAKAEFECADVGAVPHFNHDLFVDPLPQGVRALHDQIAAADGLLIVSPEYNHGIPGHLKNAIDWASRPGYDGPFKHKPIKIMTIATSPLGGARAQAWLNEVFASTLSRVVPGKQVIVGGVEAKVKDGKLAHEDTLIFALNSIDDLLDEACLVQGRPKRVIPDAWQRRKLDKPPR